VSFNPDKYSSEEMTEFPEKSDSMLTTLSNYRILALREMEQTMPEDKRPLINKDGSTNSLADLYSYTRDLCLNYTFKTFVWTTIWSFIAGYLNYAVSVYVMGGPWLENGKIQGYWNNLLPIYFALVLSHHL